MCPCHLRLPKKANKMMNIYRDKSKVVLGLLIILLIFFYGLTYDKGAIEIPVTGRFANIEYSNDFSRNNSAQTITRVSVPGRFSYSVQQIGNAVPNQANIVGQYEFAKQNGNIGLIAHNYLAGSSFGWINYGDEVRVTTTSGSVEYYVVYNIMKFKATDANNFSKPFIDQNTGQTISAKEVFDKAYKSGMVTFQTCISGGGSSTWGILIIQAVLGTGNVYTPPVFDVVLQDMTEEPEINYEIYDFAILKYLNINSAKSIH